MKKWTLLTLAWLACAAVGLLVLCMVSAPQPWEATIKTGMTVEDVEQVLKAGKRGRLHGKAGLMACTWDMSSCEVTVYFCANADSEQLRVYDVKSDDLNETLLNKLRRWFGLPQR